LTPIDDFVGTLKATNRLMMIVIIVLTIIELFFIYFASTRLSRPVENVSRQLQSIESLNFDTPARPPSNIQEIARLESAASLLRTSLKSFSSFVPLDVVRQLVKSGIPLTLGVEPRFLTVFFSDLENFFHAFGDARARRPAGSDLDLSRTGVGGDFGGGRYRRQVHRRWRHGVLERARRAPGPRAARLRRRLARGKADGAGQRQLGGGGPGRASASGSGSIAPMCWSAMSARRRG